MLAVICCIAKSDNLRGAGDGGQVFVGGEEQRVALRSLAESRDRGEADRARAVLLTLAGPDNPS